jgi:integrase
VARTVALERQRGRLIPSLFHLDGKPIGDFREEWRRACEAAGVPGRYVHDFRRSAARNLLRAGVAQRVAMLAIGIATDSIFRRYAIVDETMLREAGEKLAAWSRRA